MKILRLRLRRRSNLFSGRTVPNPAATGAAARARSIFPGPLRGLGDGFDLIEHAVADDGALSHARIRGTHTPEFGKEGIEQEYCSRNILAKISFDNFPI